MTKQASSQGCNGQDDRPQRAALDLQYTVAHVVCARVDAQDAVFALFFHVDSQRYGFLLIDGRNVYGHRKHYALPLIKNHIKGANNLRNDSMMRR